MRLKQLEVRSFKGVKRALIPLADTTVLVGANNAGKSSVLQAVHFAARAMAQAAEANKQTTLSISELEYLPTNSYRQLGHNQNWGNAWNMPESEVIFTFENEQGNEVIAKASLKSARNEGLSIDPTIPQALFSKFRYTETPFSAYIPGIAGIPLEEQRITRRHVYRKAASGDSNVVLRNILLLIKQENKLEELIQYVRSVYPGTQLHVGFNEGRDLHIKASFYSGQGNYRPIEFAGTGFLHVLQIFAYLVLFRPSVLLIDEPECHLHPTLQTKLTRELRRRVSELGSTALITTHSPFVARGLPLGSNVVWVKPGGNTEAKESELIKRLLGWGALDKPILLCTEDSIAFPIQELLRQAPGMENVVSVFPFNGVSKMGTGSVIAGIREKLGNIHQVIVHRDRDGLTDEELVDWVKDYEKYKITPWVTEGSDIESYFCDAGYISALYEIEYDDAKLLVDEAVQGDRAALENTFAEKRKQVNRRYEKTGGSPVTDELIKSWPVYRWAKGKDVISAIRRQVRDKKVGDEKLVGAGVETYVVASDLMRLLNEVLERAHK